MIKFPLLGLVVLIVQFMLAGRLDIAGISPNFLAIFIIYAGLRGNQIMSIWLGFLLGFLLDALTSTQLMGLTSLGLVVVAYLAGLFQTRIGRIPILIQYLIHLGLLLAFFAITILVYLQDSQWGVGSVFFLIMLPTTFYTYALLIISFVILRVGSD
jgi:rod shape-determining protein MreD